jgi:hypothetical protein
MGVFCYKEIFIIMKFTDLIYEMVLKEYNEKFLNQIIKKFQEEIPDLETDIIRVYVNRFVQIKDSPNIKEKDLNKYTWRQLETVVDSNQPKRIKTGKMNDGEPGGDSNLIYNENGLRIYLGKTKNACIKYGNGYSFCISSRGEGNLYFDYRHRQKGTPYFIFDDTKSSEQDDMGNFIDPDHLLVLFMFEHSYDKGTFWYTITDADNKGEMQYDYFDSIVKDYPRLKGLEGLFKLVEMDPKEKKLYEIDKKYNSLLIDLEDDSYQTQYVEANLPFHRTIDSANKLIDDEINGDFEYYEFHARSDVWNEAFYRVKRIRNKEDYKRVYEEFSLFSTKTFDPDKDFKIYVTKIDSSIPWYKEYLLGVKRIVDQYRSELSKINLLSK